jgi:tetratricopeptide (TPR) repeat protein
MMKEETKFIKIIGMKVNYVNVVIFVLILGFVFFVGYQLGLQNTPQNAIKAKAKYLSEKGKKEEAIKELELGSRELQIVIDQVELDVFRAEIYKNLARQYFMRDMWAKAIENAQKAIDFFPTDSSLYFIIGTSLFQLSKVVEDETTKNAYIDRAEKNLEKAITLNPDYIEARYTFALIKIEKRDYLEALNQLNYVLNLEPRNVPALFARARVYYETGQLLKARDDYSKLLEILTPNNPKRKKIMENIRIIDEELLNR